ncbi:hypothetical protein D9758_003593 [Tetrapyrgos nigripes]|uniref:Uncharacterized protein n=1 Tax=Tetrapyrgos nigripes TaxID=182062 RepID=A0A8H5GVD9_9AGAR|nr:hypothetical protein D9758_003593 [Tetrapyrgos nigripes]
MKTLPLPLVLLLAICRPSLGILNNVTLEETSSRIIYGTGQTGWAKLHHDSLYHNNSHAVSSDPAATATLTFRGVAVYYYSSFWSHNVSTTLQLDGQEKIILDLIDASEFNGTAGIKTTKRSDIVWSRTDLPDEEHTLVVSCPTEFGGSVLMDAIMYTENKTDDQPVSPLVNHTVESQQFDYVEGAWSKNSSDPNLFVSDLIFSSQDDSSKAVLTFTGVAVYYLAARWPLKTVTTLQLDGESPEFVDLTDNAATDAISAPSVESTVGTYAIVDAIIYTEDISSSPQGPSPQPETDGPPSHNNHSVAIGGIIGGIFGGLVAVAVILVLCHRRWRQIRRRELHEPGTVVSFMAGVENTHSISGAATSTSSSEDMRAETAQDYAKNLRRKGVLSSFRVVRNMGSRGAPETLPPPPYEA